jgi:GTP-binding protein
MRRSVVYKDPGVTRDRIFGEVQWQSRGFDIIDTGGFFPAEEHPLASKITKQIELALKDADLIYFVVDGKTGLKPGDEEISEQIRKMDKKIFLLVNKIDNRKDEVKALEFSRFGFDNIFLVSAEAGIGFGDVLDETIKSLPTLKKIREYSKALRILILGRPNSGKSTLLNSIINEERAIVDEKPGTTRDMVNAQFTYNDQRMEIIDTCGIRRRSRIKEPVEFYSMTRAVKMIENANVVILIFDATQGVVEQDRRIASLILSKAKSLVIVPNKNQLVVKSSNWYRSEKDRPSSRLLLQQWLR